MGRINSANNYNSGNGTLVICGAFGSSLFFLLDNASRRFFRRFKFKKTRKI